jgi:adenylosuccinate synthase
METRRATIEVDPGFGDGGKGTIVDYLARTQNVRAVVRYCGGAQAGHNVVTPEDQHHTFSQFGSATFVPGVRTHLSRFMIMEPRAMLNENAHLESLGVTDALARTTIDRRALVITPFQRAANRLREIARGNVRHGSCGMGVGETQSDFLTHGQNALFVGDLTDRATIRRKFDYIREAKKEELKDVIATVNPFVVGPSETTRRAMREIGLLSLRGEELEYFVDDYYNFGKQVEIVDGSYLTRLLQNGHVVFEGSQGILLDEWFGFYPHTTWSTITSLNALTLLDECNYQDQVTTLGVVRAYASRHGAGPFVTEDEHLGQTIRDSYNVTHDWQGSFRVGWFDLVMIKYGLAVNRGVDALAVTCLDQLDALHNVRVCDRYEYRGPRATLSGFAEQDTRGHLTQLTVRRPADLIHQEELTHIIRQSRPIYREFSQSRTSPGLYAEYLEYISSALKTPIEILSYGPRADQKATIATWMQAAA